MHTSSWFIRQPGNRPRFRLFCFANAGGSAAPYLAWQTALPEIEVCAVQLPGRGPRLAEAPIRSFAQLVETLAALIAREDDLPFAFFGHSLGGLLAFELARHLRRYHFAPPEHVFVSASNPPQCRPPGKRLHELDDDALIEALREYNGTPPDALADRELMALLLPAIRADFALVENYAYREDVPLDIALTVLAGTRDKHLVADRLCRWQAETSEACTLRWFEGDHFFLHAQQQAVLECIQAELCNHYA
jgi:surfactin synthase thioesterase subunit